MQLIIVTVLKLLTSPKFFISLPEKLWFCPNIFLSLREKFKFCQNLGNLGGNWPPFPRLVRLCKKKPKLFFFDQSQSRAKIQTTARKHTHSDKVQNMVVLISNVPFVIFLWEKNRTQRARFAKYSDEIFSARQSRTLATRSDLKI